MRHKSIVTLKASRKVAEESVWIAKSSVDAVDDYRLSCLPHTVHRYSSVMYLTVAIIPLICVIIQESEIQSPREEVVQSFRKALNLLQEMAPSFTLAQLMLRRLEAAVTVSNAVIDRNNTQSRESVDNDSSISGVRDASMSQGLTDLFRDFEKPANEVLGTQDSLFWTEGTANAFGDGMQWESVDPDLFTINNQFDWYTSAPIV